MHRLAGTLLASTLLGSTFLALAALLAATALAATEATFDDGRQKDEITGLSASAADDVRIVIPARPGMTLDVTLTPDGDNPASGLAAQLVDPDAVDLLITGSAFDKSKVGKDEVRWRKAPLTRAGDHVLVIAVGSPGGWRVKLGGKGGGENITETSNEDLIPATEVELPFAGLAGDTVKWKVVRVGKSGLDPAVVRIERPDGSFLPDVPMDAKGSALLDADGEHSFVFTNAGIGPGAWKAKLKLKRRKDRKRKGHVSAEQTGLVPVVKKVDPKKGVHIDTALALLLTGTDFEPTMDIRLVRNGRDDIIATNVAVLSDTEATCVIDLDTRNEEGNGRSVGKWKVSAWNLPLYGDDQDPTTLDKTSPLVSQKKSLQSVTAGSVTLPKGVQDDTELWVVQFNDEFQADLDRMGLGSDDAIVRILSRGVVEAYVIAYLRDLFGANETNGAVKGTVAVPVSFVVDPVSAIAGEAGLDYNVIDVGGKWEDGDPQDAAETLPWGFAATDTGNAAREDLQALDDDGTTRLGLGVRTRVLNPNGPNASQSLIAAMAPLRNVPLTANDERYFRATFNGNNSARVARYAAIVTQLERAAREIAAIIAHHVGRAMGLPTAGTGPMDAPSTSGKMWTDRDTLSFAGADLTTLRNNAVAHALPGKSGKLKVIFLPLQDQQPELLPNLTTGSAYSTDWDFVGGRCNAKPADYRMQYTPGSRVLPQTTLTHTSLSGTVPVCADGGSCANISAVICGVFSFQLAITDTVRDEVTFIFHRLKALPDLGQLPGPLVPQATTCRNQVLAAP